MRMTTLSSTIFLILVLAAADAQSNPIATGVWGSHAYYAFSFPSQSWDNAQSDLLQNLGPNYYLATITSQQEQDFVSSMMTGAGLWNSGEYWLGGFQEPWNTLDPNADWKWITGESWSYTNWNAGEPNDANLGEWQLGLQGCCGWTWNDESNIGNISGYVAETIVPEPTSLLLLGIGLAGIGLAARRRQE